jgi:hypothetical protein
MPRGSNVIADKWVFTHKLHTDGSFDHYKERWVLRGFTQHPGVNYNKTFDPIVKPAVVHIVLASDVSHDWPIQWLDVKNTFLHDTFNTRWPPAAYRTLPAAPVHVRMSHLIASATTALKSAACHLLPRCASVNRRYTPSPLLWPLLDHAR